MPQCQSLIGRDIGDLPLADPSFHEPGPIDIILGADVYEKLILSRKVPLPQGITLRESIFGYVVSGHVHTAERPRKPQACFVQAGATLDLLQKFWEVEDVKSEKGLHRVHLRPEEQFCEEYFNRTTTCSGRSSV